MPCARSPSRGEVPSPRAPATSADPVIDGLRRWPRRRLAFSRRQRHSVSALQPIFPRDRSDGRPFRAVISPVLLHHPHRTVADLRRKLGPCRHHSSFSQIGASGKPGTLRPNVVKNSGKMPYLLTLPQASANLRKPWHAVRSVVRIPGASSATQHPGDALSITVHFDDRTERLILHRFRGCDYQQLNPSNSCPAELPFRMHLGNLSRACSGARKVRP